MRYTFDAADAPTQKETQYYEMLGHPGHLAQGLEGGRRARPGPDRARQVRPGPLAAVPHRRGPLRGPRPRRAASRQARGAQGALVGGGREVRRAAPQRPRHLRVPGPRVRGRRARRAASTPTTRAPREVPEASAANTINVSYKILAEVEFTGGLPGRDLRPGLALRRLLAVRQGRQAHLRLQLPRHPARAAARRRRADVRDAHRRRRVHQGAHGRAPRALRAAEAVRRRPGRGRASEIRTIASRYSLCGEGLCIGYDGGDAVIQRVHAQVRVHRRPDRQGRLRRRRRRATSTSSATSPRPWPATSGRPGAGGRLAAALPAGLAAWRTSSPP